jgi:putative hemolysin
VTSSRVLLDQARYTLLLTTEPEHVRDAQRLRHQVFVDELGARLDSPEPGLDVDRFDAFCDHLIVRDDAGTAVGTYRLLPPQRARAAGGLYAENEFDLAALAPLRSRLVEIGRSCVHPDHRTGGVISLMWAGLGRYLFMTGNRWLGGCTSVPLADAGGTAAAVWRHVRARHLAPGSLHVTPRHPWDPTGAPMPLRPALPPLLRGYLRLGAQVCGPPAHDTAFGCADFFTLLDAEQIDGRHLRYLLGTDR